MNRLTRPLILYALVLLSLLLAGCATAAAEEPSPEPPALVLPTVTPQPVALAVRSSQPVARLAASVPPGIPDRIVLPSIDVDIPVVELGWSPKKGKDGQIFSEWDVADFAAGWHKNSALPADGGNVVLSGHNNIKGAVFRELDMLKRGDLISLYVGDTEWEYTIDQVLIVPEKRASADQRKENAAFIEPTEDDRLTLVSCWPRDDNSHRIIVVAHPLKQASQ